VGEDDFKPLYDLLAGRIYAFASRRLAAEAAKDVVSETFETVWRKLGQAPQDHEACVAWVYAIARFKVLQEIQRVRRKHHDNRFANDFEVPGPTMSDTGDVAAERQLGGLIYRSLSGAERELFDLLFVLDATRTQVCELLQLTPGALNTRLSRLRDRIEELEGIYAKSWAEVDGG
jgi:RNA polymerase sigma factor (sigma-70 family)